MITITPPSLKPAQPKSSKISKWQSNTKIPSQYRDTSKPSEYIDRIKITCLESGEVFNAIVNSDGTWSTNVHIVFNGSQSRFSIEGYNANNPQKVIAKEGWIVVK